MYNIRFFGFKDERLTSTLYLLLYCMYIRLSAVISDYCKKEEAFSEIDRSTSCRKPTPNAQTPDLAETKHARMFRMYLSVHT